MRILVEQCMLSPLLLSTSLSSSLQKAGSIIFISHLTLSRVCYISTSSASSSACFYDVCFSVAFNEHDNDFMRSLEKSD